MRDTDCRKSDVNMRIVKLDCKTFKILSILYQIEMTKPKDFPMMNVKEMVLWLS